MTADDNDPPTHALLRLRITTDADPSVLTRLLGYFQNLNITPRAVLAEFGSQALMHLQIDVGGLPEEKVSLITAKMVQIPCVLNAYWHYLT
jgi:hypothetical protein